MHTLQMLGLTCFVGQKSKRDVEVVGVASCLGKQDSLCTFVRCLKPFTIANLLLATERCGRQNQAIWLRSGLGRVIMCNEPISPDAC